MSSVVKNTTEQLDQVWTKCHKPRRRSKYTKQNCLITNQNSVSKSLEERQIYNLDPCGISELTCNIYELGIIYNFND